MIDILALLMMLMSMAPAIPLIESSSPALVISPSVTILQFPAATLYAKHCYLWGQSVARRDDYTYTPGIGGHKLHPKMVTWNEARLTCEEEGGHLAIINSVAESKAIADLFAKSPTPPKTSQWDYAHLGFHDLFKDRQFVTILGEPIAKAGFDEWAPGEPNMKGGHEHCGSVYLNGQLNDIDCDSLARFICEIPMPPM